MLKDKVEASYNMKQFADDPLQCCNVTGLNPSYEFVAPVSFSFWLCLFFFLNFVMHMILQIFFIHVGF